MGQGCNGPHQGAGQGSEQIKLLNDLRLRRKAGAGACLRDSSHTVPSGHFWEESEIQNCKKCLILLVGAPRFELGTPSPPDWCANRAALRSEPDSDYNGNRLNSQ